MSHQPSSGRQESNTEPTYKNFTHPSTMASTTLPSTSAKPTAQSQPTNPRRRNMSLTQTYLLAHRARAKLAGEASRPDHDLRRLVLHANTLDGLMLELADAEREQESWFNQSVKGAITPAAATTTTTTTPTPAKASNPPRHIQWADRPRIEEPGNDWPVEDVDSSDEEDDETDSDSGEGEEVNIEMADFHALTRVPSRKQHLAIAVPTVGDLDYDHMEVEVEVEEEYDEDDEERADLALSRSPSQHSAPLSPPELLADDVDDESEDESMTPPSPGEALPGFSDEHHKKLAVARQEGDSDEDDEEDLAAPVADKHSLLSESYYLRPRNPAPGLVTAISVY